MKLLINFQYLYILYWCLTIIAPDKQSVYQQINRSRIGAIDSVLNVLILLIGEHIK